jgi:hypothetical protein
LSWCIRTWCNDLLDDVRNGGKSGHSLQRRRDIEALALFGEWAAEFHDEQGGVLLKLYWMGEWFRLIQWLDEYKITDSN